MLITPTIKWLLDVVAYHFYFQTQHLYWLCCPNSLPPTPTRPTTSPPHTQIKFCCHCGTIYDISNPVPDLNPCQQVQPHQIVFFHIEHNDLLICICYFHLDIIWSTSSFSFCHFNVDSWPTISTIFYSKLFSQVNIVTFSFNFKSHTSLIILNKSINQ